jgi:hypothetical protein
LAHDEVGKALPSAGQPPARLFNADHFCRQWSLRSKEFYVHGGPWISGAEMHAPATMVVRSY